MENKINYNERKKKLNFPTDDSTVKPFVDILIKTKNLYLIIFFYYLYFFIYFLKIKFLI